MMRSRFLFALAGLALALSACGTTATQESVSEGSSPEPGAADEATTETSEEGSDEQSAAADEPRGTIAWIAPTSGQAYYDAITCAVKTAAEEAGYDTILQNAPNFDPVVYDQMVTAVGQRRPDAILIDPIAGSDATPAMTQLIDAGTPVVSVETPTDVPGQAGNVVVDAVEFGRLTARTLVEQMGETGEVMLMDYQLGSPILDARAQGIEEELAKHPGISIVAHEYGGADAAKASQLTLAALSRNPGITGIVPTDTYDMAGVVNAVKQQGLEEQITLVDIDATPSGIEHLTNGDIEALVVIKPAPYGREAVRVAIEAIEGQPAAEPVVLDDSFLVITPDDPSPLEDDPDLALEGC